MYRQWYERRIKLNDGYKIHINCKQLVSYDEDEKLFECALITPDEHIDMDSITYNLDFHQVAEYINKAKEKHNDDRNS